MNAERTKYCGHCRATLAWNAQWCHECGAGKPEEIERAAAPPPPQRTSRLPATSTLVAIAGIAVATVVAVVVIQTLSEKKATVSGLRAEQSDHKERIAQLTVDHERALSKFKEWSEKARYWKAQDDPESEAKCSAMAQKFHGEAQVANEAMQEARAALGKVEARLAAAGEAP